MVLRNVRVDDSYAIVGRETATSNPLLWDLYDTNEVATAYAEEHAAQLKKDFPHGFSVMTYKEFEVERRTTILGLPIREIDEVGFHDMLGCLPPMAWEYDGPVERFLMSEFQSGTFTSQYARLGERYFTKIVDAKDRATWLSEETLKGFVETASA